MNSEDVYDFYVKLDTPLSKLDASEITVNVCQVETSFLQVQPQTLPRELECFA